MKLCPNCGKEISENAAHCGHCGHRQESDQKKTMMGMGAIDSDWKEKIEAARAASKAKAQSEHDPGFEPTEAMESVTAEASVDGADELAMAATQLMDAVDPEDVPADDLPAEDVPAEDRLWEAESQTTVPVERPPSEAVLADTMPREEVEVAAAAGSKGMLDARFGVGAEQEQELAQVQTPEDVAIASDESAGQKRLLILGAVLVGLLLSCCVLSAAAYYFLGDKLPI